MSWSTAVKAASSSDLQAAFESHRQETVGQVSRLEQCALWICITMVLTVELLNSALETLANEADDDRTQIRQGDRVLPAGRDRHARAQPHCAPAGPGDAERRTGNRLDQVGVR